MTVEHSPIVFLIQGSSENPYKVTFTFNSQGNLNAFCTCPAGQKGQYCKHRMSILRGDGKAIVSGNQNDIVVVRDWLTGSDVEMAIHDLGEAEAAAEEANKQLSKAKKALATAMHKQSN